MLHSTRMQLDDGFRLTSPDGSEAGRAKPDGSWLSAVLFETPEEIYQRAYRALKPRSPVPVVIVRFEKFANADSYIRAEHGKLFVRMTDLLSGAPPPILESLAFILLGKLFKKPIAPFYAHRYRVFLNRRDMRQRLEATRQERGRKLCAAPAGMVYDLREVFESLNQVHFGGLMSQPALGWSLRRSRTRLGHFDPSHNTIVISRIFDQPHVPRLSLDYVMFHEMLHLHFPVKHRGARRCVHTKEFKNAEAQFPDLAAAKELLRAL